MSWWCARSPQSALQASFSSASPTSGQDTCRIPQAPSSLLGGGGDFLTSQMRPQDSIALFILRLRLPPRVARVATLLFRLACAASFWCRVERPLL